LARVTEDQFKQSFPLRPCADLGNGKIENKLSISDSALTHGMIVGDVTVEPGGLLVLHGTIVGRLTVREHGVAYILGTVNGDVLVRGSAAIFGVVNGALTEGPYATCYIWEKASVGPGM
jgi:hypothetical protein